MYDKLLKIVEENNFQIDDETEIEIERLIEFLKAKNKNDKIEDIIKWFDNKKKSYQVNTEEIGIINLDKWYVDPKTGNIHHESGKFFSIIGVKVDGANDREVHSWTQPMMKQKECGILGILCKKNDGVRHYLLQAKYEPGNTNILQLSPTLQATDSNLKRAHQGKKPIFAEYFEDSGKGKILTSVISVEDGGRFYLKTNKIMIVEIDEELNIPENFIWLNLYQIKKLIKKDLIINSLARSIFGSR